MTFEQNMKGVRVSHNDIWEKSVPGEESIQNRDLKEAVCLG